MIKKMISISNHTHDKIKINAGLEKRSVTNYIQSLLENLFIQNDYIKSNGMLHIELDNYSIISDTNVIKRNNIIKINDKLNDVIIKNNELNDDTIKYNNEDTINNNELNSDTIKNNNEVTSDLDNIYDTYFELEQFGIKLRQDNDAKPDNLKSSAYIFSDKISDHERAWLYKNPTCTIDDYKKAFPDMF